MTDETSIDDVQVAREELDAVIEEIRRLPGHEQFLAPPTFREIARVARVCPLVYVAAAEPGGSALIVRDADVVHVPLTGLTAVEVRERVGRHLDVYAAYRTAPGTGYELWNTSLVEVTQWLWDEAMGPILAELGTATEIVLIAGGLLGLLPMHAAWTPDVTRRTGRRFVLDSVSVSYVPNARSLHAARSLAVEVSPSRLLAVAEPAPVSAAPLPMARHEAMIAAAAFPTACLTLCGHEATFLSFEWEAAKADVLHLACHGLADLTSPLNGGLVLAGGRVTLRRLLDLKLRARLAVLSACETAMPGTKLPDEVVAMPTGLLEAGVAGVVASGWAVPDRATAMLMAEFYRGWWWERQVPSEALRRAQRWLRDTTNAEKTDHFQRALDDSAEWLPREVAQRFLDWLALYTRDRLSYADIHHWAGFAHIGA